MLLVSSLALPLDVRLLDFLSICSVRFDILINVRCTLNSLYLPLNAYNSPSTRTLLLVLMSNKTSLSALSIDTGLVSYTSLLYSRNLCYFFSLQIRSQTSTSLSLFSATSRSQLSFSSSPIRFANLFSNSPLLLLQLGSQTSSHLH